MKTSEVIYNELRLMHYVQFKNVRGATLFAVMNTVETWKRQSNPVAIGVDAKRYGKVCHD